MAFRELAIIGVQGEGFTEGSGFPETACRIFTAISATTNMVYKYASIAHSSSVAPSTRP